MPSAPKLFIHNSVIAVSSRIEEGLPLVPTEFINEIIWGVLAVAQTRFQVELIAFVFQANHFHMLIRVIDPEAVALFLGYVKQEITHRINRLLGKRKHTVWCEGYNSPTVLDYGRTLKEIAYVLLNPVKDHLVESMEQFPGVSSYRMFTSEQLSRRCVPIARSKIYALRDPSRPWVESDSIMRGLNAVRSATKHSLPVVVLSPYGWKRCFQESAEMSDQQIRDAIFAKLKEELEIIIRERKEKKIVQFVRRQDLVRQSMLRHYIPEKFSRSMWCHSNHLSLRVAFIKFVKSLRAAAAEVKESWLLGQFQIPFPPGLYPPGRKPMASLLCWG